MIKSVLDRVLEQENLNLKDLDALPAYFDYFLVNYQENVPNKFKRMIEDILEEIKIMQKRPVSHTHELDTLISFLSYLFYYKYPFLNKHVNVDFTKVANIVVNTQLNLKNQPPLSFNIFANLYRVLCTLNITTLNFTFKVFQENISQFLDLQLSGSGIFSNIEQMIYMFKLIKDNKQASNTLMIEFINSVLLKFLQDNIAKCNYCGIKILEEQKRYIVDFLTLIYPLKDLTYKKAYSLILFVFNETSLSFDLTDILMIIDMIPQFFQIFADENSIERIVNFILSIDHYNTIEKNEHPSLIELIITILIRCPNIFIEVFKHIQKDKIFEEIIPKVIKEIFSRKLLTDNDNQPQIVNQTIRSPENCEDNSSEMEDLDNEEINLFDQIKNDLLEYSSSLLFSSEIQKSQLYIFESLKYSPQDLDTVLENFNKLQKQEDTNKSESTYESDEKETKPISEKALSQLIDKLKDISSLWVKYNFFIPDSIAEVTALLIKHKKSLEEDMNVEFMKFLSIISLIDKYDDTESTTLKEIGYDSLNDALKEISASGEPAKWKEDAHKLMKLRLEILLFNLGFTEDTQEQYPRIEGLSEKDLKSAIIGSYVLPQSNDLMSTIISNSNDVTFPNILEAIKYVNISKISEVTHEVLDAYKEENAQLFACALLTNYNWNKDIIISGGFIDKFNLLIDEFYENESSNLVLLFEQIISFDKYHAIDDSIKGDILMALIKNQQKSIEHPVQVIHIITQLCSTLDFNATYKDDTGSKALSIAPNIFDFIDKCIEDKADSLSNDVLADAVSSVCGFYHSAIEFATIKLLSSSQQIYEVYTLGLLRFLETHESYLFENPFNFCDILCIEQKDIIDALKTRFNKDKFREYVIKNVNTLEIAQKLIPRLIDIQINIFESQRDSNDNKTIFRGNEHSLVLLCAYLRIISDDWFEDYFMDGIFKTLKEIDTSRVIAPEEQCELVQAALDQFNGIVDNIPPIILKISYCLSTYVQSGSNKLIAFQGPIFLRNLNTNVFNNKETSTVMGSFGTILQKSVSAKRPEKIEGKLSDDATAKTLEKINIPIEKYHEIVGIVTYVTYLMYQKGKELYEKEGLSEMWYCEDSSKPIPPEDFLQQIASATETIVSASISDEDKGKICQFLSNIHQLFIEGDYSVPEKWNADGVDIKLKTLYDSNVMAMQSDSIKMMKKMPYFKTADDKKWFFIAFNLIPPAIDEKYNKSIHFKLLNASIKCFNIPFNYQIPSIDNYSGIIQSLAIKISEELAKSNNNSSITFMKQFFNATALLDNPKPQSSIVILLPWASAAGKNNDDRFISEVFKIFSENYPNLDDPEIWGRTGAAISDILISYSKARKISIEEILIKELTRLYSQYSKKCKKAVNLISRVLLFYLKSSNTDKNIDPVLLHSCIIGTALYDTTSIRSLLFVVLCNSTWIDHKDIQFVSDKNINSYECVLRIAHIILERRDNFSDQQKQKMKELFLNDIVSSPITIVSVVGWMFTLLFSDFRELPAIKEIDQDYYHMYDEFIPSPNSTLYEKEEIVEFTKNIKPQGLSQRLSRLYLAYPKELNDILLIYLKKHTRLQISCAPNASQNYDKEIGDFTASIALGFASMGKLSFTSFGDQIAFDDPRAIPYFAYLIACRSEKLPEFVKNAELNRKFDEIVDGISKLNSIGEINNEEFKSHEFLEYIVKNNNLEPIINSLISFAGDNTCILNSASIEILTLFLSETDIWVRSRDELPKALWNIYTIVAHQESNACFTKPIQAILNWTIDFGPTSFIYESLIILSQIAEIIKIDEIDNFASSLDVYDSSAKDLDYEAIFSRLSETPIKDIIGAIFVFGLNRIGESNNGKFVEMLTTWMKTKGSISITKEILSNLPMVTAQSLIGSGVPSQLQLEIISLMAQFKILSEEDAEFVNSKLAAWVDEKTMPYYLQLVIKMSESGYLDENNMFKLLNGFIEFTLSLIEKNNQEILTDTETIKKAAFELNEQVLKIQENTEVGDIVSNMLEGDITAENVKNLTALLQNWKVNDPKIPRANAIIDELATSLRKYISDRERFVSISAAIEEIYLPLSDLFGLVNIKEPKSMEEEQLIRSFVMKVLKLIEMTETENTHQLSFRILYDMATSKPGLVLPIIFASAENFTPMVKESVSIISHLLVKSRFAPSTPILVQTLQENKFEKLFDESLKVEEVLELLSYLASMQMFDRVLAEGEERLKSITSISNDNAVRNFFTAVFCLLLRPLHFQRRVKHSLKEDNINDLLDLACLPEGFYLYLNKLSVEMSVKKELLVECIIKPMLKNPGMFQTFPKLEGYNYNNIDFEKINGLDKFLSAAQRKRPLVALIIFDQAKSSRESVIKTLHFDPSGSSEDEELQFLIDFRICSEFSIYSRISSYDPIACLSYLQMPNKVEKPRMINLNSPSPETFLERDIISFWRYANMIQTEGEAIRLCHLILLRHSIQKNARELITLLILKYPHSIARTLIEGFLDSNFRRNIHTMYVLRKNEEGRDVSQMRLIKLLYQVSQMFPGIFSEYGPILVANCVLSLANSSSDWAKYVSGLISQYVDNIGIEDGEQKNNVAEKRDALAQLINSQERHFDAIVQAAFELLAAIGKDKTDEFASLFKSLNVFDYKFIYSAAVATVIKLNELNAISKDSLKIAAKVDSVIEGIAKHLGYYYNARDQSWPSYFSAAIEVLSSLVAMPCSERMTKVLAWLSAVCIMHSDSRIRLSSMALLHNCIKKLYGQNEIARDPALTGGTTSMKLNSINVLFHRHLTRESSRNFLSLFSVCISVALGYHDAATESAANEVLRAAWKAWKSMKAPSLYTLLPMAAYSTLDVKEVTGREYTEVISELVLAFEEVDFMFARAYMKSASKDMRCRRERFSILCPNGCYPMEKDKTFERKDDTVKVTMPLPDTCEIYFHNMISAIVISCSV